MGQKPPAHLAAHRCLRPRGRSVLPRRRDQDARGADMTAIFDDQERLVKKVNIGLAYERDSRNDAIQVPLEDFESVLFPCPARAKGLGPKMADGKGRVVWQ